jgi:RAT1-interacting protein
MKTSLDPLLSGPSGLPSFERKLMKFWIQSFLLGVPKIVVGMRDHGGVVGRVEEIETQGIPGTIKKRGMMGAGRVAAWDGNVCINCAANFLHCEFPPF